MTAPPVPAVRGDATAPALHEKSRFGAAAGHAPRVYPGPLGELVFRELNAYVEFGYRFQHDGLIPRLAAEVLATRSDGDQSSSASSAAARAAPSASTGR
jgi:hypothetical protein